MLLDKIFWNFYKELFQLNFRPIKENYKTTHKLKETFFNVSHVINGRIDGYSTFRTAIQLTLNEQLLWTSSVCSVI